ncbi:glycoside hydrolase family 3 C-terminal domain-containing protein, partial [Gemmiger formicilis]|uniref:glycoside hydrolase family 3 C-terminal domain-containing protein n=1 Tax=Gemmiger formicilis TaxID=745368 RepID=UPI00242F9B0A
ELGFLEEYGVDACLLTGMTGSYGCTAIADVLAGEVNPSGKTVNTYASSSISAPSVVNGGVEGVMTWGNADELNEYDQINGDENIDYYIIYSEGIYVGYKYYETRYEDTVMGTGSADGTAGTFNSANGWNYAEEMCYPFGYGLSYTTFEQTLDSVTYDEAEDTYTVAVTVTNTGDVAGKDVVQVYAQTPYGDYERENLVEKSA